MVVELKSSKVVLPASIFPLKMLILENTQSWQSEFFVALGLEAAQCKSLLENKKKLF